ncbi:hypothetical protein B484DRAFT_397150 [Ochromonadaceae sp. CCMP2298]|nr:hypothetical protein B484DRAFT_397150 [Ochromonadaceae sp. CCMP2298]
MEQATRCKEAGVKFERVKLVTVDLVRLYSSILLNRPKETPWHTISVFSNYEPWSFVEGEELVQGEYYISTDFQFGELGLITLGLRPLEFVVFCVERGFISWDLVTGRLVADEYVKGDHFANFVKHVYTSESFRADDRKSLGNMFCGSLGGQHTRSTRAIVCENKEYADATVVAEERAHHKCSVDYFPDQEEGDSGLYFVRTVMATPKTLSSLPMHRQIIVAGWMALQTLVEKFTALNPGCRLLSYNTDAATFALRPGSERVDPDDLVPGGVAKGLAELGRPQYESPHLHNKAMLLSSLIEVPKAEPWHVVEESDFEDDTLDVLQHCESLLITGAPGVGKSHLLGRFMKAHPAPDTVIGLGFTNVCVANMHMMGVTNCSTLDAWFETMQGPASKAKIATLSHAHTVVVDEPDQTNPVQPGQKRRVYLECDFLRRLCYSNRLNMCYKKASSRYDEPLHEVIKHLKATGHLLPSLCANKKRDNSLVRNLSYFNDNGSKTTEKVNAAWMTKQMNDLTQPGTPVIVNICDKAGGFLTSEMYTVRGCVDDVVTLCTGLVVPKAVFLKKFGPNFCCTVARAQGCTFRYRFNVHDLSAMSKRDLYTSLSRATCLDDVHFDYTTKHFVDFEIERGATAMKLNEGDEKYKRDCVIYKILCPAGLPIYIGHSTQGLSYRFKQHRTPNSSNPMRVAVFLRANPGCTIEWVQDAHCENLRAALKIETAVIAQFIQAGAGLLNSIQLPPKAMKARATVIQVAKFISRKQAWTDDGHRFRIYINGKRCEFQYGTRVSREQAAAKAGIVLV